MTIVSGRRTAAATSAVLLVLLVVIVWATTAAASFLDSGQASHTLSTDSLAAPTSPATAHGTCIPAVSASIVVSWTATSSSWADGYEILRSLVAGGPYSAVGTVSGQSTTSYSDGPLLFSTTYGYVVRATKGAWRSSETSEVARTTRSVLCT